MLFYTDRLIKHRSIRLKVLRLSPKPGPVMQNHIQQRVVHFEVAVVFDEAAIGHPAGWASPVPVWVGTSGQIRSCPRSDNKGAAQIETGARLSERPSVA